MAFLIGFTLLSLVVLPVGALVWLARRSRCRFVWGLKAAAVGSYVLATFYLGGWQMLSYYGRYVLVFAFALVAVYGGWRMRHRALWATPSGWTWVGPVFATLLLGFGIASLTGVYQSRQVPEQSVDLAFPLQVGAFYVASGGREALTNPHTKVAAPELEKWRGQLWGLDVVQLYPSGNRAMGLYPTALDRYAIFGTPVYAPCDGTVEQREDGLPDLTPPDRDTSQKAGNFVMLQCRPDAYLVLAHLKRGSVSVQARDSVTTGTRLGAVGNSGNSWEPHLHVSAQRSLGARTLLDADPRPMTFNGAFPLRNDVIRGGPD